MRELTISERIDAMKRIFLYWNESFSPTDMKLLGWIAANTIGRGKLTGNYSHRQFISGVPKRGSDEYWCYGVGMSLSSVRRSLDRLHESGVIRVQPSQRGALIEINLEWMPQTRVTQ